MVTTKDVMNRRSDLRRKPRRIYNDDGAAIGYYSSSMGYPLTEENWLGSRFGPLAGVSSAAYPNASVSDFTTYVFNTGYSAYTQHKSDIPGMLFGSPYSSKEYSPTEPWDATQSIYDSTGKDALQIAGEFFEDRPAEFIFEMRVNDRHDATFTYEELADMPLKQELWNSGGLIQNGVNNGFDFESERAYQIALDTVLEVINNPDKWKIDGVYLRFYRHLGFFKNVAQEFGTSPTTQNQIDIMTSWVYAINDAMVEVSKARMAQGKEPLLLFINVPDHPDYCKALGLDVEKWIRDGVVDVLIPAGYHQFRHIRDSVEWGHRYGVGVCYEIQDSRYTPRQSRHTTEGISGRALQALGAGCDGFEIFNYNYYTNSTMGPSGTLWRGLANDALRASNRIYYQDWTNQSGSSPGTAAIMPPPNFFPHYFRRVSPVTPWNGDGEVYVELYETGDSVISMYCEGSISTITINGTALSVTPISGGYSATIPSGILRDGLNRVEVTGSAMISDIEITVFG